MLFVAEYGNTSAASIPLALDEAVRANTIAPGNVVRSCPVQAFFCGSTGRCIGGFMLLSACLVTTEQRLGQRLRMSSGAAPIVVYNCVILCTGSAL